MATVVSLVGSFLVGRRLAGQPGVDVGGVPPPRSTSSITGGPISGDGHLCGYAPGAQLGVVTILTSFPQSRTVTGIGSAQAFGIVTRITGGVISSSSGVPSAQAFGTLSFKTTVKTIVTGVGSAQAFGALTLATVVRQPVNGVGSVQAFGAITTRSGFTKPVGGVSSAQAFGTPRPAWAQALQLAGIPSAQSFGALTIKGSVKPQAGGVPSAQAFGAIGFIYRQSVAVSGLGSAQEFGTVLAYVDWLHDLICIGSPDQAICGEPICGDGDVCGGYGFAQELDCLASTDRSILNTFLVGQRLAGGLPFTDDLVCIESPEEAICDIPTICGAIGLVCGGQGFIDDLDCLLSPDPTILNEFLVGQRLAGGPTYIVVMPEPLVLDLQPVGCS